ncbi:unnamed protein product [Polarella glacialis]|uniref:Uncharacterized protein n=1 Tax=Polarella glacialis TaxID=89957 RepID=A0A813DWZ9_POLGL|nr:unnamed protein product [Polarella glacialis]CAE8631993.1 unnamed protein product [Polarella glacialis]CAE8655282.1 unnamed protein product [Polarella glacialis]CAE8675610.1 unnamed protein product [Polarella glacialis]|mmetsp:Transcript_99193/g.179167  ORF Transcript_99193/g.179167 Transcript_99193/m.179167 type:complete len:103 (+) Transcript_99193:86-394(+)
MSSAVGDASEMRRRKAETESALKERDAVKAPEGEQMDEYEQEYVDYFKKKYGDNPRTDILGIDGAGLFCIIYIVVCGVIFSILFMSVYSKNRDIFNSMPSFK